MGSSKSGSVKTPTVVAETPVTPAVATQADSQSGQLSAQQKEALARMRGIRGTYNRFGEQGGSQNSRLG